MAFWRKRIELPDTFYQAAGDCLLYFTESQTKVHLIETSFMSVHNACELLDLVEEGFAKLADLIRSFPVNTDSLVAQFDMTDDIHITPLSLLCILQAHPLRVCSLPARRCSGGSHSESGEVGRIYIRGFCHHLH